MRDEPESDTGAKQAVAEAFVSSVAHAMPAGETIPCDACVNGVATGTSETCHECRGHGVRLITRPPAEIVHVPTLRVACGCGTVMDSPVPVVVKDFQRTGMAPPFDCKCGRIVIGQRRLVRL
jgi:hypothetical protein